MVELMKGVPHCLVLENSCGELQLLVPNYDAHRPRCTGEPFGVHLIHDRSNAEWQQTNQNRYFLLPVHTSRSFLLRPSLSASLYLMLLRFLHRDYTRSEHTHTHTHTEIE